MNSEETSRVSNLQRKMEKGKFYSVRCLRTGWDSEDSTNWIPVIGPIHNDREHINFEAQHYHVDFRFLGKRAREAASRHLHGTSRINLIFVLPISNVKPEKCDSWFSLDDPRLRELPQESYMRTMRLKFKADYPCYDFQPPWLRSLEEAYIKERLSPTMVCPHKGASLSGIRTDSEGLLICPLHGLRWNTETGEMSRRTTPMPEEIQAGN